jgi:hypothetical protein
MDQPFGRRRGQTRPQCGNRRDAGAGGRVEHGPAVEEEVADGQDLRPAVPGVRLEMEVEELAVGPAKDGGHGAAGRHEQKVAGNDQMALGRNAAFGNGPAVRLAHG